MDKDKLLAIANEWAYENISCWLYEYGAWDNLIEDGTLTPEELDFIQDHYAYNINGRWREDD